VRSKLPRRESFCMMSRPSRWPPGNRFAFVYFFAPRERLRGPLGAAETESFIINGTRDLCCQVLCVFSKFSRGIIEDSSEKVRLLSNSEMRLVFSV